MLKPAVLVFDDSTAAIDAATEQRIRLAMRSSPRRVTIIIAHRLSSLMHADQILFIEDGEIVERGTHEELLASGGRYKALYDLQVRPGPTMASGKCMTNRRSPTDVEPTAMTAGGGRQGRGRLAARGEELFGKAFDRHIVRRIWAFVSPYRSQIVCRSLSADLHRMQLRSR